MIPITIIVPVHNSEKYVGQALETIEKQSIGMENLQVIIVDDCSSDRSLSILQEFEQRYPDQVVLIPLKENVKQGAARNIALQYATGEYVMFLDSDDMLDRNACEKLYVFAKHNDLDIVKFQYYNFIDGDEIVLPQEVAPPHVFDCRNLEIKKQILMKQFLEYGHSDKLYKTSLIYEVGAHFKEGITIYEEPQFTYPLELAMGRCGVMLDQLYYYRHHSASSTGGENPTPVIEHAKAQLDLLEFIKQMPEYSFLKAEINVYFYMTFFIETIMFSAESKVSSRKLNREEFRWMQKIVLKEIKTIDENEYIHSNWYFTLLYELCSNVKDLDENELDALFSLVEELNNCIQENNSQEQKTREILYSIRSIIAKNNNLKRLDILVPYGGRHGSVESLVNKTALYLLEKGVHVRVVQLVWSGENWTDDRLDFYVLKDEKVESVNEFEELYSSFVGRTYTPDIVLATAWPYLAKVARYGIEQNSDKKCKVVSWLHTPIDVLTKFGTGTLSDLRNADRVFVLTKYEVDKINTALESELAIKVWNPVCMESQEISGLKQKRKSLINLVFVGRLSEEKGVEYILQSLSKVKGEWILHLFGNGEEDYENKLHNLAIKLEIEQRLVWHGWVENPWNQMKCEDMDFSIIASDYEGFSLVAVESLSKGIPLLSTRVGIVPELIEEYGVGYLFDKDCENGLSNLIDKIMSGALEIPTPENCRKSIVDYDEPRAMQDFFDKLLFVLSN